MLELQAEIDAYWERERKEGFVRIKRAAEKLRQASSIQSTQKEESMPRLKGEEARVAFRGRVISEGDMQTWLVDGVLVVRSTVKWGKNSQS